MNQLQHTLLRTIYQEKQTTAKQLSSRLLVDESTISRHLRSLLQLHIIEVVDLLPAGSFGGRQSRVLSINSQYLKVLGVSIEEGELCLVSSDFSANALSCKQETIRITSKNFGTVLSQIVSDYRDSIDVLALATPGLVSSLEGKIVYSQALGIENLLLDDLFKHLDIPYIVMNDANAAAAAYFSKAKNLVYFLLSIPFELSKPIGLGAGIILNGRIYEGSNNSAGELGEGVPLFEGSEMTLEQLLSNKSLFKQIDLKEFLNHICSKISTAVNLIDPELIVLGGDFCVFEEQLLKEIVQSVERQVTVRKVKALDWQFDRDGSKTIAIGAVHGFLNRFFEDLDFANKVVAKKEERLR
ncbi:MAG: ROK family protein [Pseudothermotoga sp.]